MTTLLEPAIRTARSGDRRRLFATLTAAFAADPAARWTYADADDHHRHFPAFAQAFAGRAIEAGTADGSNDFAGVALWLPPGAGPDEEALVALVEATVCMPRRDALLAMFEAMGRRHPREPHWYLPLIGVAPAHQGSGLGAALMRHGLERSDRDRLPAYLEATSPRSVPFYRRHGFDVVATIEVGDSPPIFPMLRPA